MQEMEPSHDKPTIAEGVYIRIRNDIIAGKLQAGQVLRSDWMRAQYDVGISPLREALTRLTSERMLVAESQRGFRVAPIDANEVRDVLATRILIETEALKRSIERGSVEWESRVLAAYHVLSRGSIPRPGDPEASTWIARHRDFHMSLLSAAGSDWLPYLSRLLFDQSERYRALRTIVRKKAELEKRIAQEHKRIVEATLDRDAPEACRALADHYTRTSEVVIGVIETLAKTRNA